MMLRNLMAGLALSLAAGVALAAPAEMTDGVLTDPEGMTLYTYDEDSEGMSACTGDCATNWPPFMAEEGAEAEGDFTLVERDDGQSQWAYMGKPLYYWSGDEAAGDMAGDGMNDVWHVVK